MKKIITLFILMLAATSMGWAQVVGIGTSNPQEKLHVAGEHSALRIDGLNNTNHSRNLGGADFYNLVADSDGRLTLSERAGTLLSESMLASPVTVKTSTTAELNSNELYATTFTLPQRAYVVVTYYISMNFESYNGASQLVDGRSKVAQNFWYLGDGVTADTSKKYGTTSMVYANANCDTASGYIYNSRSVTIPLDAGTYSIHLNGVVDGGGLARDASFSVSFGDMDRLDIHAIYL